MRATIEYQAWNQFKVTTEIRESRTTIRVEEHTFSTQDSAADWLIKRGFLPETINGLPSRLGGYDYWDADQFVSDGMNYTDWSNGQIADMADRIESEAEAARIIFIGSIRSALFKRRAMQQHG